MSVPLYFLHLISTRPFHQRHPPREDLTIQKQRAPREAGLFWLTPCRNMAAVQEAATKGRLCSV
jgi:hypothetical protein